MTASNKSDKSYHQIFADDILYCKGVLVTQRWTQPVHEFRFRPLRFHSVQILHPKATDPKHVYVHVHTCTCTDMYMYTYVPSTGL